MKAGPRRGFYSLQVLGCKVNQAEARAVEDRLRRAGYDPVPPGGAAGLAVLHACAVTAEAQRQSAQALRRLRRRHPNARLLFSGCGAGTRPEDGAAADEILPSGPGWEGEMSAWLDRNAVESAAGAPAGGPVRLRGFLKIQDGCDRSCSYCLVRILRGPSRDRAAAGILEEARRRLGEGCRELVVTGVSMGLYGRGAGRDPLPGLLRRLAALPGLLRLRLSSLHPGDLTPGRLAVWAELQPVLAPHLHLPLQSGSDRVLRSMRRGYTTRDALDAIDRARSALDGPAVLTDLIAGFPGETPEDALQTERFCRKAGFQRLHVFPYSARPGTEAAGRTDPVPAAVARERARRLRALSERLAAETRGARTGREAQVLVESADRRNGTLRGYTERYEPARFAGPPEAVGRIVRVRLEADGAARITPGARPAAPSAG